MTGRSPSPAEPGHQAAAAAGTTAAQDYFSLWT
jgi:hypothetical protein